MRRAPSGGARTVRLEVARGGDVVCFCPRTRDVFLFLLAPKSACSAKLGRHGRTWTLACRGFGLPALLLGLARAARCPAQGGSRPRSLGGVKDGTTGQLAVPWRPRASPLAEPIGRTLRSGV